MTIYTVEHVVDGSGVKECDTPFQSLEQAQEWAQGLLDSDSWHTVDCPSESSRFLEDSEVDEINPTNEGRIGAFCLIFSEEYDED